MTTPDMPRANSESTSKPYNESGPDTELLPGHIPPGYQSWSKVWIPKTNRDSGQEEEDSPLIKPTIHELEYDDEYDKQAINDLITHVEATWYKNASEDIVKYDLFSPDLDGY
ncbi:hypothetical protein BT96DRAFT_985672 [Gymnopus androsaceus JB14]|uniref:Uncharacterized protein n=1 Tax=Gymnopus androsaceus JB14 TaxID=1447944 RepID=A0A6A4IGX1_9AGAR|nr:hypothetical protein BT96DRAFT_985672 [Gymnopus androsaceus JB14]